MRPAPQTALISGLALALLVIACSAGPDPRLDPAPCPQATLSPSPLWTAATTWNQAGDRLLVVDPRHHTLSTYAFDGQRESALELDPLAELDYSVPLRLETSGKGYLLGDDDQLLWLGPELDAVKTRSVFDGTGKLSDFSEGRRGLVAWADFEKSEGEWSRGFVRLDEEGQLEPLRELPIEQGGEVTEYYLYNHRPYIAHAGRHSYVLRLTDPPRIERVKTRGLEPVFNAQSHPEGGRATALYGWNGRLFLLWRIATKAEVKAEAKAPGLVEAQLVGSDRRMVLQSLSPVSAYDYRWELQVIDPRRGREEARLLLPSAATRLVLVPGDTSWGLLEEGILPNPDTDERATLLSRLPARWFEARSDAEPVPLSCRELG